MPDLGQDGSHRGPGSRRRRAASRSADLGRQWTGWPERARPSAPGRGPCRPASRRLRARRRGAETGRSRRGGEMISVLLAEDQAMVRGALVALLELEGDIQVVASVASGEEVVPTALRVRPSVALLDIELPGMDGLRAATSLRKVL